MKTATATKTTPIRERYVDERYVDDTRGQKRYTVVLEFFDKMGEDVRVFKFTTIEEARDCWRTARRSLANRGLDRA
jgi:hypothetical protein